jgi:hypothetical protein
LLRRLNETVSQRHRPLTPDASPRLPLRRKAVFRDLKKTLAADDDAPSPAIDARA